jgi:hypothetical protein
MEQTAVARATTELMGTSGLYFFCLIGLRSLLYYFSILKMETACPFEIAIALCLTTRRCISEDLNLHIRRLQNLNLS